MVGMLQGAWRYRGFIRSSIRHEFASRFARSRLSGLWLIVHPLAQVAIFAFVLSEVLSAKLPGVGTRYGYALYLMAGILAWALFSEVVSRSVTVFVDNGNLLKKIVFPRVNLPIIVCGVALVNNVLLLLAILGIFALLGHIPTLSVLWLPALIGLNLAFATGLGLILGVLNVFIRDVAQVVPILLQFGFWLTPIVYTRNVLPERYHHWFAVNPLLPIVESYQAVLVYGEAPPPGALVFAAGSAAAALVLALVLFRRAGAEMVDAL